MPSKIFISSYTGKNPHLRKKNNGDIVGVFNVGGFPTVVEMDKNLNVLIQGTVDNNGQSYAVTDLCFNDRDEAIIAGTTNNSLIFFAKFDDAYKSSCDISLPLMSMTPDTLFQLTRSTTMTQYNLMEVNHIYSVSSFVDSQRTVCTVPLSLDLGRDTTVCKSSSFILPIAGSLR